MKQSIVVENVSKAFENKKGTMTVLEEVNLDVRSGEFLAIVGPSGCGKSTLLSCMAGFERVSTGRILIDGVPIVGPSRRRVFVFQETGIFPWLSVWDNIGFGLDEMSFEAKHRRVMRYVNLVGLEGFERSLPAELSGGMKQRVEFARALVVEPDVIFLDEPFGALDAITRLEMRREILRIWKETGKTCILVTHDVGEAVELADRIAVMTRRPARVHSILSNPLARPRNSALRQFRDIEDRIYEILDVRRDV